MGFRLFLSTEPRRRDVGVYVGVRVCPGFRVGLSYKLTTGWEVAVALLLYYALCPLAMSLAALVEAALYPLAMALAALVEAALLPPRYYCYPRGLLLPLIGDEESAVLPPPPSEEEEAAVGVVGLAPSPSLPACHLLV